MPNFPHQCHVAGGAVIACYCTTGRDHDEGSMDMRHGPYWLAGLAPDGSEQVEQQHEQEVAAALAIRRSARDNTPQDARPMTPQPAGPPLAPAPQPVVEATYTELSPREFEVLFRAPDGITFETVARDDVDGVTARVQLERLLAHEQELYEAREAARGKTRGQRGTLKAMPSHPQDAPVPGDAPTPVRGDDDVFPLPYLDNIAVLGNAAVLRAVRDAVEHGSGFVWLLHDPARRRVTASRLAPNDVTWKPASTVTDAGEFSPGGLVITEGDHHR